MRCPACKRSSTSSDQLHATTRTPQDLFHCSSATRQIHVNCPRSEPPKCAADPLLEHVATRNTAVTQTQRKNKCDRLREDAQQTAVQTQVNYLWSVAPTPFGPFSNSARLTFALIDAARRNIVFSSLNASIAQVLLHIPLWL